MKPMTIIGMPNRAQREMAKRERQRERTTIALYLDEREAEAYLDAWVEEMLATGKRISATLTDFNRSLNELIADVQETRQELARENSRYAI